MSYPVKTLEEFKTQLSRFVDEELRIPTINVRTQSDGPSLNVDDVIDYFSLPVAKRNKVLNITSFNLGHTGLDGLVMAPRIVRDLDLVSRVWPSRKLVRFYDDLVYNPFAFVEKSKIGTDATAYDIFSPPRTMSYLLLGPEGAYTDWHLDFAGSSVWYHVVKGKKVFMAAPDTAHNIRQFLIWSSSDDQNSFLGEKLEKRVRVELNEGDTMFLPGGWFHAVSTPVDSVVVGGNYLNPLRLNQILTVRKIERRLDIPSHAEYPKFDMLMYYAAGDIIKRCQLSRGRVDEMMVDSIVTRLEAKGLEGLASYLESAAEELESNYKGRMSHEKRLFREDIKRCKKEVLLITSFLRNEMTRLKTVYTSNTRDDEEEVSFLDEAQWEESCPSRARRKARRSPKNDSLRRNNEDDNEDVNGGDHEIISKEMKRGQASAVDVEDVDNKRSAKQEDCAWSSELPENARQGSSEQAEESVEVLLSEEEN
jgi:hypothetical protein